MKIKTLKINKMAWFPAVCLMMLSASCDLATEPEIDGPTQVEASQKIGPSSIAARVNAVAKDGKEIFDVTEVQPNPPGGMEGWNKYLTENLSYPQQARSMGIEGTVIVAFVINSDGSISDTEILRGIGGGADEEAVRVVQNSPNWEPARQKDRIVNSRMRLPVRFQLSSEGSSSGYPSTDFEEVIEVPNSTKNN